MHCLRPRKVLVAHILQALLSDFVRVDCLHHAYFGIGLVLTLKLLRIMELALAVLIKLTCCHVGVTLRIVEQRRLIVVHLRNSSVLLLLNHQLLVLQIIHFQLLQLHVKFRTVVESCLLGVD